MKNHEDIEEFTLPWLGIVFDALSSYNSLWRESPSYSSCCGNNNSPSPQLTPLMKIWLLNDTQIMCSICAIKLIIFNNYEMNKDQLRKI